MITAPEITQEVAQLKALVSEKESVISEKEHTISAQEKSLQAKEKRIRILEEYILSLQQKTFGSSSEKQEVIQAELVFTEAEATADPEQPIQEDALVDDTITIAEHKRKKKRLSIPVDLPRIDIIHDLLDGQKICPHDGAALKNIGFESHEQLDIIPAKIQVLHHKRLKYACPAVKSTSSPPANLRSRLKKVLPLRDCSPISLLKSMLMPCLFIDRPRSSSALALRWIAPHWLTGW